MRIRNEILPGLLALLLSTVAVVYVASAPSAWAQLTDTGTVVGSVTDQSNAVVGGATVTLTDTATSVSRTTTSNDAGRYTFANVPPGTYDISVTKSGFALTKAQRQQVTVGSTLTVNLALQVGGTNTVVEVTAAGTELQTMDATVGESISGSALDTLPGLGRDVSTFVELQPGVAPDGSVAGANQDQNSFQLDGGNNSSDMDGTQNTYTPSFASDPTGGLVSNEVTATGVQGASGGGGPTGVMPTPADSIEEFRVGTNNQTADFNASAGAQIRLVTKRGTNTFHGTAYEYYLDNNWSANSFDNNLSGTARPSYHYSRFGGSFGGPLLPKEVLGGKTYFFANYEGFRWPNSATINRSTPSADMRLGILQFGGTVYNLNPTAVTSPDLGVVPGNAGCAAFPGGVCDPRGIGMSQTVQALFKFMPPSNAASCSGLTRCDGVNVQAFRANYPLRWRDDFGVFRLDHDFSAKWHFYSTYRYYHQKRATSNQVDIGGFFPGDKLGVPSSVSNRPQVPWYLTAGMTTNVSNNVTNDFHYSFLRNFWARASNAEPPQVTGLGGALEPFGEDALNVLAPYNLDTQDVRTRFWDGEDHMIRDDVSWLKGLHFLTFGGIYQHNWNYHQRTDNGGGINYNTVYWLGRSVGSLNGMDMAGYGVFAATKPSLPARDYGIVLGAPAVDQIAFTRVGPNLTLNPPNTPAFDKSTIPFYNLYVNDSWRMKPSLTVSYGLGWTLEMPPKETNGKQIVFVDSSDKPIDTEAYLHQRETAALAGQVFNPIVGFSEIGNVAGHPSHLYNPFYKAFSPRVAVAWSPFGSKDTVVRAGYSLLYGRLNGVALVLVPLLGTGLIQPVQCISPLANGTCGGASAASTGASTPANSFRICPTTQSANCGGGVAPLLAPGQPTTTLPQPDFPGINAVAAGPSEVLDPHFQPSRSHQYDLTIQHQLNRKMSIEIGYVGRHETHEFQPVQLNAVPYMMTMGGQRFDKAYGQMTMQYCGGNAGMAGGACAGNLSAVTAQPFFETALAGTGYCNVPGAANCTQAVAIREGNAGTGNIGNALVWSLWNDLDGGNAACAANGSNAVTGGPCGFNFARSMMTSPINCPTGAELGCSGQLTSGVGMNTSLGYGNYNGLFLTYKMASWHGLTMQSNFTWSKSLGTVSEVQATSQYGISDPFYFNRNYGYQPWDRKFLFNVWFTYTPPFFQDQKGALGRVLGGWSFAPILDAGSGLPLAIFLNTEPVSAVNGGQAFGAMDDSNFGDNEHAVQFCGGSLGTSRHDHFNTGGGVFGGNSPANQFADPGAVFNCFRNPVLGIDNGHNGGAGDYRGMPFWNVDFSVKKNILVYERFSAELTAVFSNLFNHNQLADANFTYLTGPADFGALENPALGILQQNTPRKIEVGMRVRF